jgi:hypothetical protein
MFINQLLYATDQTQVEEFFERQLKEQQYLIEEEAKTRIPVSSITSELILDALKVGGWEKLRFNVTKPLEGQLPLPYVRNDWQIKVSEDYIQFTGWKSGAIDLKVDLIEDEELICTFLEWLYEGGKCPLTTKKGMLILAGKTTNRAYPNKQNSLTRKQNKK